MSERLQSTQSSTPKTDVAALEQLAKELDAELAKLVPAEVMRKINRRIMTARMIEMHAHLEGFDRMRKLAGA